MNRALVVDHSAPERVAIREVPEPEPIRGEVLVEVHAISLNRGELNRLPGAADGWRPGWDVAGVRLDSGARVVGVLDGGAWAERVAVPEGHLAELPEGCGFEAAAALPVAGLTALRMLRLAPILGRRVLVTGASGGVGRFAVQLAHRGGAEVTAIAGSAERAAGLNGLGADRVVTSIDELSGRYDLVLESAGGDSLARLATMVDPLGTLVMFGNSSNSLTSFDVRKVYLGGQVKLQSFTCFVTFAGDPPGRDLGYLAGLVAEAALDPQVSAVLRWEQAAEGLARLRDRSVPGKLVLKLR